MNIRDRQIVEKIIAEIGVIHMMLECESLESFVLDERTKRAVCMTLINIGELVKNLTVEFKDQNPEIPWRNIAGMRDVTAHKYQTLKMGDVWTTVQQDVPKIEVRLKALLNNG